MRMSIFRSFPWLECGQSIACAGIRPQTFSEAQTGQRVQGEIIRFTSLEIDWTFPAAPEPDATNH